jgi:hypothetical protein
MRDLLEEHMTNDGLRAVREALESITGKAGQVSRACTAVSRARSWFAERDCWRYAAYVSLYSRMKGTLIGGAGINY